MHCDVTGGQAWYVVARSKIRPMVLSNREDSGRSHGRRSSELLPDATRRGRSGRHGNVAAVVPDLDAWQPWHPRVLGERLAGLPVPWCVAAGWALDLFRGRQTRDHGDVEIPVPRARFAEIAQRFPEVDFHVPVAGTLVPASADTLAAGHQTWALDRAAGCWRLDVFREPHDGDVWLCRRDARIRRPYADLIRRDASGLPFLAPEVALLFKAKAARDEDCADFAGTLPLLDADQRQWLADALALVHPDHSWRDAVAPG